MSVTEIRQKKTLAANLLQLVWGGAGGHVLGVGELQSLPWAGPQAQESSGGGTF